MGLASIAVKKYVPYPRPERFDRYLKLRSIDAWIRSLKGRAEGFRVLGPLHMHCCAEAG